MVHTPHPLGLSFLERLRWGASEVGTLIIHHVPPLLVATATGILGLMLCVVAYIYIQRRATQRLLQAAGLPTVFWTPRFFSAYHGDVSNSNNSSTTTTTTITKQQDAHIILKSTSITRMLPRMQKLKGPLGMYGTVYGFNTAVVHVAHPVAAKAILTSTESNSGANKKPAYNHFANFCGRGVFTADGDDWRAKRVAVLHALVRGEGALEERVLEQAHRAANELLASIATAQQQQQCQNKNNTAFNVVPLIQQATIGLIFRYITHQDIPKGASKIDTTTTGSISTSLLQRYLTSVTNIRMIILAQSRSIWFLLPRWCYAAFAKLYRQEEATMTAIRQFAHVACQTALPGSPLKRLQEGTAHQNGKRMYQPIHSNTATRTDASSSLFSNKNNKNKDASISQDLLEETITLLFAGQDTSAATLSWTLHLLSLHPAIQRKLGKEVRSVVGGGSNNNNNHDDDDDVRVTKAMIGRMPYLDAVIKESMRLYPVAPFVVRKLTEDIVVPNHENNNKDTIRLPRNAMACLWIYGLHHHPDFWSQPEDFVPERWLSSSSRNNSKQKKKDPGISNGAYMPFAVGPRNCLGQPLAQWILRSLLARLVHRYNFQDEREGTASFAKATENTTTDRSQWRQDMQAGFTVLPQGGVHLVATEATPEEQ